MDVTTILGLVLGFGLMAAAILAAGEPLKTFSEPSSYLIVFGGAFSAFLLAFPLMRVLKIGGVLRQVFFARRRSPESLIAELVRYAEIARRDGILALENLTDRMEDPFIVRGIRMAVDGTDPELIRQILEAEAETVADRHRQGKQMLDNLAKYTPAFGMIGTLIGLVIMLNHMDDPARIGPGMAVALLTTFYGAVAAYAVFAPMADKLAIRSREEILMKEIVIRGVMSIQSGDNPRVVEQKLNTFLPARLRAERDRTRSRREARPEGKAA